MNMCEKHGEHSIELDCPPGNPRPWDLINDVIAGTGLPEQGNNGAFFGASIWMFDDITCDEWDKIQKVIAPRIESLYYNGTIRYGSW